MTKAVWGARITFAVALLGAVMTSACGDAIKEGTGSSYLILTSLQGAPGNKPGSLGSTVASDVITVVDNVPTTFSDVGQATFQLVLKDPGPTSSPNIPSAMNSITLTQYHVQYVRSDGRNTPGVDVPFAFDGGLTQTISGTGSVGFTLVRNQAKDEAPLKGLVSNNIPFTTTAQVTFYGHDQAGRGVSVTGSIEITFANFGD